MKIYLDNNASTRVDDKVLKEMKPYFTDTIAPPSSDYGHSFGIESQEAIKIARDIIAKRINANSSQFVFTSGMAESNNQALKGVAFAKVDKDNDRKLLVASSISHSSVLDSLHYLKKFGFETELLDVDHAGYVDRNQLETILEEKNPLLVSIPHANGEIGTVEDIKELGALCNQYDVIFHVDASYSFGKIPIDVKDQNIDLMTITSHLIHGPKGIGGLYVKKGTKIDQYIHGGLQENRMRGGTENVPGIVGFGKATALFTEETVQKIDSLRDKLWKELQQNIDHIDITGPKEMSKRLSGHLSFVINFVEGESVLLHLDMLDIMIATGSACSSKNLKPSHVLAAIGLPTEISHGSVRIGVSKYNTEKQIDQFVRSLAEIVTKLRKISPVDDKYLKEYQAQKDKGLVQEHDHGHHHDIEFKDE